AVVTIRTLEGDNVDDFTNRLFQKWGVGPKGKDRGVMILLAVQDRQYRVEVGYGLEPILPDGKVGGFGRQMVPLLRQNQYGPALLQLTAQVAAVIAQDRGISLNQPVPRPAPVPETPGPFGLPPQIVLFLIIFLIFGGIRFLGWLLALAGIIPRRRGGRGGWM